MLTRRSLVKSIPAALVAARSGIAQPLAALSTSEIAGTAASATTPGTTLPARDAFTTPQFEVCLNNARWHPLSIAARKATEDYLEYKSRGIWDQNGHISPASILVRESFAKLINATPDEVAFVQSTTAGENLAVSALGLTQPGSFNIVTDALHFDGSLYLYSQLEKRGVEVRVLKPRITPQGWSIDKSDIETAVDKNTRLIAVSWVSMINGFTHDVAWLASLAHAHGARLYVDAVQAAGCVPIDVRATGIDFLASASYKWLMGDFGLGFLYAGSAVLPTLHRTHSPTTRPAHFPQPSISSSTPPPVTLKPAPTPTPSSPRSATRCPGSSSSASQISSSTRMRSMPSCAMKCRASATAASRRPMHKARSSPSPSKTMQPPRPGSSAPTSTSHSTPGACASPRRSTTTRPTCTLCSKPSADVFSKLRRISVCEFDSPRRVLST
jgi:hypothetical protein